MGVPREDMPITGHRLRVILEGQGPEACKLVLESELIGAVQREHVKNCPECHAIVLQLYPDGVIPIKGNGS
jgi:hypothetical protein